MASEHDFQHGSEHDSGHRQPAEAGAVVRLLPDLALPGSRQMALDEALLNAGHGTIVRIYTWPRPTLSLGYFQDAAAVRATLPEADRDMDMVRRITGGGAIWHADEVTYALVGRLGEAGLPERTRDCYPVLHSHLQAALAAAGASVQMAPKDVGDRAFRQEVRCFAAPAQDDLLRSTSTGLAKVVGSAGRTHGDRVLIHGSLKLASNAWDQEVVAGCGLGLAAARAALLDGLQRSLSLPFVNAVLTPEEDEAWQHYHAVRYGLANESGEAWVLRRGGPRP
jgi:lipoate-protein ligase A